MTNDAATQVAVPKAASPARIATLVAVPVTLLAGLAAYLFVKPTPAPAKQPHGNSTAAVAMRAVLLPADQGPACAATIGKLPAQIGELTRRPVTAGPDQNAAYGEPPLTVVCGGSIPAFAATDLVYAINNTCWHPDAGGKTWVTVDRKIPVTATFPDDLAGGGSAQWLAAISPAIEQSIPPLDQLPSGCKPQA